jgi:hypothetical protein
MRRLLPEGACAMAVQEDPTSTSVCGFIGDSTEGATYSRMTMIQLWGKNLHAGIFLTLVSFNIMCLSYQLCCWALFFCLFLQMKK